METTYVVDDFLESKGLVLVGESKTKGRSVFRKIVHSIPGEVLPTYLVRHRDS